MSGRAGSLSCGVVKYTCGMRGRLKPKLLRDTCRAYLYCRLDGVRVGCRGRGKLPVVCGSMALSYNCQVSVLIRGGVIVRLGAIRGLLPVRATRVVACLGLDGGRLKLLFGFCGTGLRGKVGECILWSTGVHIGLHLGCCSEEVPIASAPQGYYRQTAVGKVFIREGEVGFGRCCRCACSRAGC